LSLRADSRDGEAIENANRDPQSTDTIWIDKMSDALSIRKLQSEFEKLPGIGPKSAQRIVYWLLNSTKEVSNQLASSIIEAADKIHFCNRCFNYSEDELCAICADDSRAQDMICVITEPKDISAIERTREFEGLYHVLGGAISPIDGIGPDDLKIRELMLRLEPEAIKEVIIATNSDVEGETTAIYLSKLIKPLGVRVTRLASGLPIGGDLEFADELTLGKAIEQRREL
jgi:recombination protein RecR